MENEFFKAAASVKMVDKTPRMREYKLMYLFGAWVTDTTIYAASDAEAIHDADNLPMVASDKLQYCLFCGNRRVKTYPTPSHPFERHIRSKVK